MFTIRESSHRILNPFDDCKLATLGRAIGVERDQRILDRASGKGELLCTWARDHEIVGTGVDLHPPFVAAAEARASELGVSDRVTSVHDDASGWVPPIRSTSQRASAPRGLAAACRARSNCSSGPCNPEG